MPISRSSKKSLRKSRKNRKSNVFLKNKLKDILKKFLAKPDQKNVSEAQSVLDKAVKAGIYHKNKVARIKSQLSKKVGKEVEKKVVKKPAKKKAVRKVSKKTARKMS
jgi:small subunit ribosomal protein S20